MSPAYLALTITAYLLATAVAGVCLWFVLKVEVAKSPALHSSKKIAGIKVLAFILAAGVVFSVAHSILTAVAPVLLPPETITGYITNAYDTPEEVRDSEGGHVIGGVTPNSLRYVVIGGNSYMVNNAGEALIAAPGDHVRVTYTQGNRWVTHLSWIGAHGELLEDRPGGMAGPAPER